MTRRQFWSLAVSLVVLALAASAVGVRNGFTFDDRFVVLSNPLAHSPRAWRQIFTSPYWPRAWGGDGYRPLTMLAFSLEWAAGHGAPWVFHAANVLLYGATAVAVFWLASLLLPAAAAWIAAALFAVHPVHVEAVANIVGQSELLVGLFVTLAVAVYIRGRQHGELVPRDVAAIAALYVAACFSKEHGIVLPALLVAAEWTVIRDERSLRDRLLRALRPFYLGLAALACGFMLARSLALPDLAGFQPLIAFQTLHLTTSQRILTAIGVAPHWGRLLFWPAKLSAEYGPPYIDIAQSVEIVQLPGALLLVGILGLAVAVRRRWPLVTFGVAWICLTLLPASNFVAPTGILLAERTLFLPSCGAMLIVASFVPAIQRALTTPVLRLSAATALGALITLGGWRSATRSTVWRSNRTLFEQTVRDAPLTYRSHYLYGMLLFQEGRKREGEIEYQRALRLFPYDPFMLMSLAERYRDAGACDHALPLYRAAFDLTPDLDIGHAEFSDCLMRTGNYVAARREVLTAIRDGHANLEYARHVLAVTNSAALARADNGRSSGRLPAEPNVRLSGEVPRSSQNTVAPGSVPRR